MKGVFYMKKIKSKAGYIVYEATENESRMLGGIGVCDFCGKHTVTGYLIPVMNAYYCPECYKSWDENSKMYPEDLHIEKRRIAYYESMLRVRSRH